MTAALLALATSALALSADRLVRYRLTWYARLLRNEPARDNILRLLAADLVHERHHVDRVLLGAAVAVTLRPDVMAAAKAWSRALATQPRAVKVPSGMILCPRCHGDGLCENDAGPYTCRVCLGNRYLIDDKPTGRDRAEAHAALERLRGETLAETKARLAERGR